jgi:hypothetical protein
VVAGGGSTAASFTAEKDVWTLAWGRRRVRFEEARAETARIRLAWSVPGAAGRGLELWRRAAGGPWSLRSSLTAAASGEVRFDDSTLVAGGRYGYRLVDPASAGVQPIDQVWVEALATGGGVTPGPAPGRLLQVDGNPAVSGIRFTVRLDRTCRVRCVLRDLQGRVLRRWDLGVLEAGEHPVDGGVLADAAPGVWFLTVDADGRTETRKLASLVSGAPH